MISRDLKMMADDLDVSVVALSQVRRESDQEKRPPRLSDLRESGAIEQDADVVVLLHRERDLMGELSEEGVLSVAKQRNGETGSFIVSFDQDRTSFKEK